MRRIASVFSILTVVCCLLPGATAVPSTVAQGRNDGNAHLCQQGGWRNLARAGSSSVPFASQRECVTWGAQGGTVDLVIADLSLSGDPFGRSGVVQGTGFAPGSTITVEWDWYVDGVLVYDEIPFYLDTDFYGNFTTRGPVSIWFCAFGNATFVVTASDATGTVYTESFEILC